MKNGGSEYEALSTAMLSHSPACQNDDRFTADALRPQEVREMRDTCRACPLIVHCRSYANAIPRGVAFAGFWGGQFYGKELP